MHLTGTNLIFGAAHAVPVFLVGAATNNRFFTLLAAAGMSVVDWIGPLYAPRSPYSFNLR